MNKLIGIFIFLAPIYQANAQYNTELIDTTKIWSTADVYTAGGNSKYSFYHKLGNDTVINNQNYTKIYRSFDEFMTEWELHGFIRKVDQKYYLRNLANEVGLAYDFSASVGDIIFIDNPFAFYPFQAEVLEIDSIFIEPANEYRKRIKLIGPFFVPSLIESWIEGIGSDAGLVTSGCHMAQLTGSAMYVLLCYFESGQLVYKNQYFPVCFYPVVGMPNPIIKDEFISLFPNPVANISNLKINYPTHHVVTINIYNSVGVVIEEYKMRTPANIKINRTNYKKGIYFYQIYAENELLGSGKFIVQ